MIRWAYQDSNNKTVTPVAPSPPAVHTRAVQVLFLPQKTQFHMQTNKHGLPESRQDKAPAQLHERKQGWKGAWGAQAAQGTPASRPRVENTWGTLKRATLGNHRQMAMPGSTTAHPGPRHICQLRKMCVAVAQLLPASKLPNALDRAQQHAFRHV